MELKASVLKRMMAPQSRANHPGQEPGAGGAG